MDEKQMGSKNHRTIDSFIVGRQGIRRNQAPERFQIQDIGKRSNREMVPSTPGPVPRDNRVFHDTLQMKLGPRSTHARGANDSSAPVG
nr:hypothetical protein Iba_contig599CG0010 [Ipomoea batatas]